MRLHSTVRRALLGLTVSSVVTTGALTAGTADAVTPQTRVSASWLVHGLDHGLLQNSYGVNYFSSIDTLLGLEDVGARRKAQSRILAAFERNPGAYVGSPGSTKAGALAKLVTAVEQAGIDPASYAHGNLLVRLENRIVTSGAETGRAKDQGTSDNSNTVGQSFAVRALALSGDPLTGKAVSFLLKQQCARGFFRAYEESSDHTCDGGTRRQSSPDLDSTAFAILALAQVRDHPVAGVRHRPVRVALRSAGRWLANQQAANGSFSSSGDFAVRNANSTGVAAQALAAVGRGHRARAAAEWVSTLRVTRKLIRHTALKRADRGAIAYTRADLRTARQEGITADSLGTWQYATAQAFASQDLLR